MEAALCRGGRRPAPGGSRGDDLSAKESPRPKRNGRTSCKRCTTKWTSERTKMLDEARQEADELLRPSSARRSPPNGRARSRTCATGAADLAVSLATALLREAANGSVAETFLERLAPAFPRSARPPKQGVCSAPADGPTAPRVATPAGAHRRATTALARATGRTVGDRWKIEFGAEDGPHRRRRDPLSRTPAWSSAGRSSPEGREKRARRR